jgi:hypothetical protein
MYSFLHGFFHSILSCDLLLHVTLLLSFLWYKWLLNNYTKIYDPFIVNGLLGSYWLQATTNSTALSFLVHALVNIYTHFG